MVIATVVSKYSDHQPLYRQAVILDLTSLYYPTVTAAGSFGNMPAKMPIAAMQYDVNGWLNGLTTDDQDGRGPLAFANASYYPAGQLSTLRVQGWLETRMYNSLIQLTNQTVPGVLNMTYNYSGTQNNGRIYNSVDAGADPLVRCRRHGGMAGYCSPLRRRGRQNQSQQRRALRGQRTPRRKVLGSLRLKFGVRACWADPLVRGRRHAGMVLEKSGSRGTARTWGRTWASAPPL